MNFFDEKDLCICFAFANTAGGILIIGIEDTTHYIVGIKEPHELEEKLANLISDTIAPHIIPEIDIILISRSFCN